MKKNSTLAKENFSIKSKKPLKTLYKGIKKPVFRTLFGSLLYMIGTLVIATQGDALAAISIGNFTDLSPIITYALMCAIGYVFFYASVVADLGYVELAARVRKKVWKKVLKSPLSYYDKEGPNKVISRVTNDPEYSYMPFKLLQLTFTLLVFMLLILVGDAAVTELALILMLGFVVTMIIMFISAKLSEKGAVYMASKLSSLTAFLAERFNRIKFIKAMNSEEKENCKGIEYIEENYEAEKYNAVANTFVVLGQSVLPFILRTAAFLFGAIMIANSKIDSTTALVAFFAYGSNLVTVFQFFAQFPSVFAQTKGGSKKIVSIFEEEEENIEKGKSEFEANGDIKLENVSFGYDENKAVENVSLTIPKGKVTAIIGPNGSGKTTVLRLIDRLYPDFEGNIKIGEENSSDISLRAWREKFGIVSQNAALFEGSIRENICYGVKDVKEEELQAVVKLACLEDVVNSHEGGLDFNVGFNGEKLSGGEQQRVAIARAMIKNADYLIMDEATANLDAVTEKQIKNSVAALTKGRTTIIVAHSYNAVSNVDNVIVMNGGTAEAQGTPEELLQTNDFFKSFAGACAQ